MSEFDGGAWVGLGNRSGEGLVSTVLLVMGRRPRGLRPAGHQLAEGLARPVLQVQAGWTAGPQITASMSTALRAGPERTAVELLPFAASIIPGETCSARFIWPPLTAVRR
ncbi:hypothetical protein AHIS1636_22280 [Arthrobacter mangrovi]|uniref:Uncharacterized protein n=1 Tax=Arthrobacter mangrovi TaxID=2966350 RepID=A0ABQ5MUZ1_9MICC|nr:hypothetical protein AHIS1636_22280 [Arthrobacter mangrovi]